MIKLTLKYKKLTPDAIPPKRATDGSAAFDLFANNPEPVTLFPGKRALIPTGISIELPNESCAAFVFARSGLAIKKGVCLSNGVGVIDSDYRGEVCVGLLNVSDEEFTVNQGDRIAQLAVLPLLLPELEAADELSDTERGDGGFGSTGMRRTP